MMLYQPIAFLLLLFSMSATSSVTVAPGINLNPPAGYTAYNLDPTINSNEVGPIYDPNFIPGFEVGLTNVSISWQAGAGYIGIGYRIGPWQTEQIQIPHLAVGPQCCNFREIPRTQQFRRPEWGDYYYVLAGFLSPGVNVPNYTTNFVAPAYIGLRTDWDWVVSVSMNWSPPLILRQQNRWAAIGLAATEYVPSAPKKLVYSVVNFWMDSNSSNMLHLNSFDSSSYAITSSNVVVYYPLQLTASGNLTVTVDLLPYLDNTLRVLGLQTNESAPPVISYVYLNIEGYNFQWNMKLYSMFVMSNHSQKNFQSSYPVYSVAPVVVLMVVIVYLFSRRRTSKSKDNSICV